jgi:hypothetical protein
MTPFGHIPPEPPVIRSLDGLCPKFRDALFSVFPGMDESYISESLRTDERQIWLFGFGRDYDDDRGIVTNASTADHGWHKFGLAVDFRDSGLVRRYSDQLQAAGLSLGLNWPKFVDPPHVQMGPPMRQSPSSEAARLFAAGGYEAVWQAVGAA